MSGHTYDHDWVGVTDVYDYEDGGYGWWEFHAYYSPSKRVFYWGSAGGCSCNYFGDSFERESDWQVGSRQECAMAARGAGGMDHWAQVRQFRLPRQAIPANESWMLADERIGDVLVIAPDWANARATLTREVRTARKAKDMVRPPRYRRVMVERPDGSRLAQIVRTRGHAPLLRRR